ncbi:ankyrin repeat-containing domain protein [Xylaria scruposa]|nr:ankyrin repeat-containing domain protein [Xylaria scruposa]
MDYELNGIDAAVEGTCKWLLGHKMYETWVTRDQGLLWIKGKPGSGKSTLLKYALNNMVTSGIENAMVLRFSFYGRSKIELQRTPLGLYRSLLHQVLSQAPAALLDLVDTFQQRCKGMGSPPEKWQWHPEELWRFLERSLQNVPTEYSVWLFVDALDECGSENAVELARKFQCLFQRPTSINSKFHICISCRHYPILDPYCELAICVENENRKDIAISVDKWLSTFQAHTSSDIPEFIKGRASGLFLWAKLVVGRVLQLDSEGFGLDKIKKEIDSIPPGLNEIYHSLTRDMRQASLKLIQWICFSTDPLSIDELRWAMVVEVNCPHRSLREYRSAEDYVSDNARMKRRVETLSCGLAEITTSFGDPVVQLIHQSVKDFFVEKGLPVLLLKWGLVLSLDTLKRPKIGCSHESWRQCASAEGSECNRDIDERLKAISRGLAEAVSSTNEQVIDFIRRTVDSLPRKDLPSLIYGLVGITSSSRDRVDVYEFVREFFEQISEDSDFADTAVGLAHYRLSRICVRYLEMEEIGQSSSFQHDKIRSDFPFLYYATTSWVFHTEQCDSKSVPQIDLLQLFDWPSNDLVELWLRVSRHCLPRGSTLVHVSSRYQISGLLEAILERVDRSPHIDSKNSQDRTPLSWAAGIGNEAIVKLLLKGGADIESKDGDGRAPLLYAAWHGHEAVVEQLLEKKANIESRDDDSQTPQLWIGWKRDHGQIAQMCDFFLRQGNIVIMNPPSREIRSQTALPVKRGDNNSQINWKRSPLMDAASHFRVSQMHEKAMPIKSAPRQDGGRTALSWAAEDGNEAIVRILLDRGANTQSKDGYGRTPLSYASWAGHKAVAKMLLDKGADIESKDREGMTSLSYASWAGHKTVAKLLLDKGADIESKDRSGRTPLV